MFAFDREIFALAMPDAHRRGFGPPPAGWRRVDSVNYPMILRGAGVFASGWVTSAVIASAAGSDRWFPLAFPVTGPFIAIETLDANLAGTSALVLDGVVQSAGLLGIVAGLADDRAKLVRLDPSAATPAHDGSEHGVESAMKIGGAIATVLGLLTVVAAYVTWQAASSNDPAEKDGQKASHVMLAAGAPTLAGGLSLVFISFGSLH